VDDGGIFCNSKDEIKQLLKFLSRHFVVKDLGEMETFVGCKIINNKANDTVYIHQPKLLLHLKQEFGALVESLKEFKTPAPPRSMVKRPDKEDILITVEQQTKFRSGVGMLLYLVKHSRFDIANSVRELSKVADGATIAHWKLLLRCIKYVITTEYLALKLKPNTKESNFDIEGTTDGADLTELEGISDSEYGADQETRISVFGWNLYFCGALIAWKSKASNSVTLSSTEAEYIALSEITKEIMFVKQVLETMGIGMKLPIIVQIDNVGAIYLSNNYSLGQRTKHIDIRRHFV
jgi:hypothetical protein